MRKRNSVFVLVILLLFGCAKSDDPTAPLVFPETPQSSEYSGVDDHNVGESRSPLHETPTILSSPRPFTEGLMYEELAVDYVFLTDGTQTMAPTFVKEGDVFLGWLAEHIVANVYRYDDGSIAYWNIRAEFSGEAELCVRISYIEGSESGYDGVFVRVNEGYEHLIPSEVNRIRGPVGFQLWETSELEELISDEFSGEDGVIEECGIVIKDYMLELDFSGLTDRAKLVRLIRNEHEDNKTTASVQVMTPTSSGGLD